ncbi:hypothetical protein EVB56_047 [Rhizobium phage RHph_Y1_10]|nr:hypothetical protein EVB56_047 [Rhizobium phage RHph_Y1_10]
MSNFHVGQKVVLAIDFAPEVRASAPGDEIILPVTGTVYTIRDIGEFEGDPLVFLEEIVNRPRFYLDAFALMEQGFGAFRFRPVVENEPSIEIFTAMLNTQRVRTDA